MQVTIGERQSGKTTKLIKRSAAEGSYILVATKRQANNIFKQASEMGIKIPFPVTIDEVLNYRNFVQCTKSHSNTMEGTSVYKKGILIDEISSVLEYIFNGIPIHEITITDYGNISNVFMPKKSVEPATFECRYTAAELCEAMENMVRHSKMKI